MNRHHTVARAAAMLALVLGVATEARAQVPSPDAIVTFQADPASANRPPQFAGFEVTRDDLSTILTTYRVVSRDEWYGKYHHVAFGDRTGTFTLAGGGVVTWLVRPGGLARLTLPDDTELHLTLPSGLSAPDLRTIATRHRNEWLAKTRPDDERWLAAGSIASMEQTSTGWHVVFETKTGGGPDSPEGLHVYYLHVYVDPAGRLQRIVRGPDLLS